MCVKCTGLCKEARLEVSLVFFASLLAFRWQIVLFSCLQVCLQDYLDVKTGRFVTVEGCFILLNSRV